jgi:hypothetical protein
MIVAIATDEAMATGVSPSEIPDRILFVAEAADEPKPKKPKPKPPRRQSARVRSKDATDHTD